MRHNGAPLHKHQVMRGFLFLLLSLLPSHGIGDTIDRIDSTVITASRAGRDTPVPHSDISKIELKRNAASSSIPMTLALQPSVITTNEGGTGLGYSAMRIRGVTGSQTSVSLNGITLNDAESQEVFWVNIPALSNYLGSIQLQRGLGTTSCGPGAFGASVNMVTDRDIEHLRIDASLGSFGTRTWSISAPLVRIGRFSLGGAYSNQQTDGYVRNAFGCVHSAFGVARWSGRKDFINGTILFGQQHTGITWEGEPLSQYESGNYTYNPAGEHYGPDGEALYYDNQSDNYRQLHLQIRWRHLFSDALSIETTFNHTGGYGYYEQYKLAFQPDGNDAVTQDILDNGFYVLRSELAWNGRRVSLSGGIYTSDYRGDHIGKVISPSEVPWYSNDAVKREADAWLRGEFKLTGALGLYSELQFRTIEHIMTGPDEYGQTLDMDREWNFLNPRLGLSWRPDDGQRLYASAAMGHREPGRADLQADQEVRAEKMYDFEAGYEFVSGRFSGNLNLYAMEYRDMLLETGRLNDAGYAVKENVPRAWRRGVELAAAYKPSERWTVDGNLTLSANKIKEYTAFVDMYDADWNFLGQKEERYGKVDMLLSPSAVGRLSASYAPRWMSDGLTLSGKYVGTQYWDNTGCADRRVPGYFVTDFSAGHTFHIRRNYWSYILLSARLDVGNVLNNRYYAYAWVWRAEVAGKDWQSEGLFPQAPMHATLTLSVEF